MEPCPYSALEGYPLLKGRLNAITINPLKFHRINGVSTLEGVNKMVILLYLKRKKQNYYNTVTNINIEMVEKFKNFFLLKIVNYSL